MYVDPVASNIAISPSETVKKSSTVSFEKLFMNEVSNAENNIQNAEKLSQLYAVGEMDNLHQVMIAISKAQTSFDLVTQVRNRLVESTQELLRMSI